MEISIQKWDVCTVFNQCLGFTTGLGDLYGTGKCNDCRLNCIISKVDLLLYANLPEGPESNRSLRHWHQGVGTQVRWG